VTHHLPTCICTNLARPSHLRSFVAHAPPTARASAIAKHGRREHLSPEGYTSRCSWRRIGPRRMLRTRHQKRQRPRTKASPRTRPQSSPRSTRRCHRPGSGRATSTRAPRSQVKCTPYHTFPKRYHRCRLRTTGSRTLPRTHVCRTTRPRTPDSIHTIRSARIFRGPSTCPAGSTQSDTDLKRAPRHTPPAPPPCYLGTPIH
jgi:hypothetical protein